MFDEVASFPLCWPEGRPRTPAGHRDSGAKFGDPSVYEAVEKLKREVGMLCASNVIVSTSVPVRQRDGLPLSRPPVDGDPGVAVYFNWRKKPMVIACDTYRTVQGNLRGVALSIEAMRAIERHGGTGMLEQAFTGFAALPAGGGLVSTDWRSTLGVGPRATLDEAKSAWRKLLQSAHPDKGGSDEAVIALNTAMEMARAELDGR